MKIKFMLNGKNITAEAANNKWLIDVLREEWGLTGAKASCRTGICGACTVLFNGVIAPSCLIPLYNADGAVILTIEGFEKTEECYDILEGFKMGGVENCGYCNAGKIFIADSLVRMKKKPEREAIVFAFNSVKCRCTDADRLVKGVTTAWEIRKRRIKNDE